MCGEFYIPSKWQTLLLLPGSLYCGKWEIFQIHEVIFTLVQSCTMSNSSEKLSYTKSCFYRQAMRTL